MKHNMKAPGRPPDKELFWNLKGHFMKKKRKLHKQAGAAENEQLNFNFFGLGSLYQLLVDCFRLFDEASFDSTFCKMC